MKITNLKNFLNSEKLLKRALKEEVIIYNKVIFKMDLIGGEREQCYAYFTNGKNDDNYFRIDYTLFKIAEDSYKGYDKILNSCYNEEEI